MANRPVFTAVNKAPYFTEHRVEFVYNPGLAPSQKRKNICAIHEAFAAGHPGLRVLEISSKSMQPGGVELSAFNLLRYVPQLDAFVSVECIYQGCKRFELGGPFTDLLTGSSRAAKKDERLRSSGTLIGYDLFGTSFPADGSTLFYDYLYISALLEPRNRSLADILLSYDGFTDIEFNSAKSHACQARAAAKFVALMRTGELSFDNASALLSLLRR